MFNLKVVSTFAILALSSLASADHCNSTGQKADQPTMDAIRTDLSLESICSSLIGDYAGKEERNTCIEIGGGKYDFTLRYKGDGYRNIAIAECKDGMKKQLGCARGGKQGYGNWWYRADYNKGMCTDPYRRSVDVEAEPVENVITSKTEAVSSVDEPEVAEVVRRFRSRAFKA